jgi:hypothetical protein
VDYPRQGQFLGRRCEVAFDYDVSRTVEGRIVRDDADFPGLLIIALDDGRYVTSGECQYRTLD